MDIDPKLLDFATPRQREVLQAVIDNGSMRAAARALGINEAGGGICRMLQSVKAKAAQSGYSPEHDMIHTVPDGFTLRGVSTYYHAAARRLGAQFRLPFHPRHEHGDVPRQVRRGPPRQREPDDGGRRDRLRWRFRDLVFNK